MNNVEVGRLAARWREVAASMSGALPPSAVLCSSMHVPCGPAKRSLPLPHARPSHSVRHSFAWRPASYAEPVITLKATDKGDPGVPLPSRGWGAASAAAADGAAACGCRECWAICRSSAHLPTLVTNSTGRPSSMSQDQPAVAAVQLAAQPERQQAAGRPAERGAGEQPAAEPAPTARWNRAFQDCPWDEDPECICAENTLQEPGRGVDKDEPDI